MSTTKKEELMNVPGALQLPTTMVNHQMPRSKIVHVHCPAPATLASHHHPAVRASRRWVMVTLPAMVTSSKCLPRRTLLTHRCPRMAPASLSIRSNTSPRSQPQWCSLLSPCSIQHRTRTRSTAATAVTAANIKLSPQRP
jgi:hypothetical protein